MRPTTTSHIIFSIVGMLLIFVPTLRAADEYPLTPDSLPQPGVPEGKVSHFNWTSKIFVATERDCWVYVPAQYDASKPTPVMIFQDGGGFQDRGSGFRVPVVLDNLISKKEIPPMLAVFLNPGVIPASGKDQLPRFNRSYEYDSPSDLYARFLLEEILPEIGKTYNVAKDGNSRGVCGISSGGSCSFTAAWLRPKEFTRVISFIGSFTDLHGDNAYPDLIRKREPQPIRIFQQDGNVDQDIWAGSWWMANLDLNMALDYVGYEHTFVKGTLGHDGRQGIQILPDALRYVWKDYPQPIKKPVNNRQPVMEILLPGEEWQTVAEGFKFTEGPAPDRQGNVYFSDIPNHHINKVDADGKLSTFVEDSKGANGLMFGPDGKLYACQGDAHQIVSYDSNAKETVVATNLEDVNDLAITHAGGIYCSVPKRHEVDYIAPGTHEAKVVDKGLHFPNGVILTPDQSQLIVADSQSFNLCIYKIEADGSLTNKQPYFTCYTPHNNNESGADGLAVDSQGRLYACTRIGLQVFDQAGRVIGIIDKPQEKWLANAKFGGKDLDTLYATCGDKLFKRKTKAKGVLSSEAPVLPPPPRL